MSSSDRRQRAAVGGGVAYADPCKVTIESNDMMQFSAHEMTVPADCAAVEVTLRHAGKLPAAVMGHDWVLAKDSDVSAIVHAGQAAGLTTATCSERSADHRRNQGTGRRPEHHGEIQHRGADPRRALLLLLHLAGPRDGDARQIHYW